MPAVDPAPRGVVLAGDGPPEWAYSRESDLDRFRPLVASADALADALVAAYVVVETDEVPPRAFRGRRLTPATGASLVIGVTDYPGVVLTAGHGLRWYWPTCGCDACAENALDGIRQLHELVDAVVEGSFSERWDARGTGWEMPGRGESTADPVPDRAPGSAVWPPWPRRDPPWEPSS